MGSRTGIREDRDDRQPLALRKSAFRENAETILICVIAFLFLRAFVLQQSEIPSGSMEDTVLPGDYILVNRFLYSATPSALERRLLPVRSIARGDLIVFKHPGEPERDFIKRVIGLPGELVEVRRGYVFVNGRELDEPYVNPLYRERQSFAPTRVPEDRYFVMGDHRNNSADSRAWGTVPTESIKGRAFMVLFSTQEMPRGDEPPGKVTIRSTLRKIWYLVFHSRWDRAFRLIR